jgi:hypothetical protein
VLDSSLWQIVRNARSRKVPRRRGAPQLQAAYRRDFEGITGLVRRLRRA